MIGRQEGREAGKQGSRMAGRQGGREAGKQDGSIVNRGKWLGIPTKVFVVCFCSLFWGLTLHKT